MANRGTPIPWNLRSKIAELRRQDEPASYREIADRLGISKTTVQKYASKIGTNSLPTVDRST